MSSSETWSPEESEIVHSSSSARTEELEISQQRVLQLVLGHAELVGQLGLGRGALQLVLELGVCASSISRARARTERGTQSSERSSSMIAPRMRVIAKVSNLISRSGSKRSIAPIRPIRP